MKYLFDAEEARKLSAACHYKGIDLCVQKLLHKIKKEAERGNREATITSHQVRWFVNDQSEQALQKLGFKLTLSPSSGMKIEW
jgi:hypothetical protein